MERREFLRQAAAGAAGLMLTDPEKEVVDSRLTQKAGARSAGPVPGCAFKGIALSDLCERLRGDTVVHLASGPSVADEKVTLFCQKIPLRDVMRQLSRSFGYTWLRTGAAGQYRYELMQDLRSQLLEEELRNRDRNAALLALEQEIERYRPFLDLSPDEALARSETASPAEKQILENLGGKSWGPAQMYFKLSRADLEALRAGQKLRFDSAWDVARSKVQRPHLPGDRPRAARPRLATFTPAQRQEAMSPAGLPFTRMSLKPQQQFIMFSLPGDAEGLQSPDELAGATLRVDYQQPGWYEWRPGSWYRWATPTADGKRVPRLLLRERTREAALQAARRYFPPFAQAVVKAERAFNPGVTEEQLTPQAKDVVPTTLELQITYFPGSSHRHVIVTFLPSDDDWRATWEELGK